MKRTALKKVSKKPISKIQRDIWIEVKRIIRKRYKNTCYTCGKTGLEGVNWQTGHMIPKSVCGAYLKYDLRNLRPQCYACNINRSGMGALFIEKMRKIEGDKYVDDLLKDMQVTVKAYDFYLELLEKYRIL